MSKSGLLQSPSVIWNRKADYPFWVIKRSVLRGDYSDVQALPSEEAPSGQTTIAVQQDLAKLAVVDGDEKKLEELSKAPPISRMGKPEEIASVVKEPNKS
jgi:hypothetical protein